MRKRIMLRYRNICHSQSMSLLNQFLYTSMTMIGHIRMIMLTYQFHMLNAFPFSRKNSCTLLGILMKHFFKCSKKGIKILFGSISAKR